MSNSKVITGLLNTECATITENIKLYMDTKLNEINTHMAANIQQYMTENINKFYTGFGDLDNEDSHTDILFDTVCDKKIIDAVIHNYTAVQIVDTYGTGTIENTKSIIYIKKKINVQHTQEENKHYVDMLNKTIAIIKILNEWTPKTKCFKLTQHNYDIQPNSNQWSSTRDIYYFNNFIISHLIIHYQQNRQNPYRHFYKSDIHSLPYNMLFTIGATHASFLPPADDFFDGKYDKK